MSGNASDRTISPGALGLAALGFRAHTGWAAMVGVGARRRSPYLIVRKRLDISDPQGLAPSDVYHAARQAGPKRGAGLVKRAKEAGVRAATAELGTVIADVQAAGWKVAASGILVGTAHLPDELEQILASHALVHGAEGMLYRDILMAACDAHGLRVVGVPERDVWHRTASALGLDVAVVQQRVVELGRQFGPPWAQDQKLAAAAAWLALTSVPAR